MSKGSPLACVLVLVLLLSATTIPSVGSVPAAEASKVFAGALHSPNSPSLGQSFDITKVNGNLRVIVILAEFTDTVHTASKDQMNSLVFDQMSNYWRQVSYNQLNVTGDTVGWINLGHNEAYYGRDVSSRNPGSDQRDTQIITDACALTKDVEFSQYDNIMVVFAGHGQDSDPRSTNLIWSAAYISGLNAACGDTTFDRGAWSSELQGDGGLALGTITHEFGHTIGLPDLYDADPNAPDYWRTGVDYLGFWSLMGSGAYGGPEDDGSNPVGLEAWSRIKLGWLSGTTITPTLEGLAQPLNQLGDDNGPRALRLPASGDRYYLVEARMQTGVDRYLRDSGVLVTLVDESKDSGEGIVKVMDCHPETRSIDDASCQVNESWSDPSNGIYMRVVAEEGTGYIVAFANTPITAIEWYTAKVTAAGLPASVSATVTMDGKEYSTIPGSEDFVFTFPVGSTHTVALSQSIVTAEGIRFYAADNSITIDKQGTYAVNYVIQYGLVIQTATGTSVKWFTPDQTATVGPFDQVVTVDSGTRYLPLGFLVDEVPQETAQATLHMDKPHTVTVRYTTQYLLKITSDFGDAKGGGWYTAGDIARYSVTTPYGFFIQRVFVSWTGDVSSNNPQGELTMNRPYTIKANWRNDYTQLPLLLIGLAVLAVLAAVIAVKTEKRRPPLPTYPSVQFGSAPSAISEQIFCRKCGARTDPADLFCSECGARTGPW